MSVVQNLASQGNPAAQAALTYLQNGSTPQQAVMGILQQRGKWVANPAAASA